MNIQSSHKSDFCVVETLSAAPSSCTCFEPTVQHVYNLCISCTCSRHSGPADRRTRCPPGHSHQVRQLRHQAGDKPGIWHWQDYSARRGSRHLWVSQCSYDDISQLYCNTITCFTLSQSFLRETSYSQGQALKIISSLDLSHCI